MCRFLHIGHRDMSRIMRPIASRSSAARVMPQATNSASVQIFRNESLHTWSQMFKPLRPPSLVPCRVIPAVVNLNESLYGAGIGDQSDGLFSTSLLQIAILLRWYLRDLRSLGPMTGFGPTSFVRPPGRP